MGKVFLAGTVFPLIAAEFFLRKNMTLRYQKPKGSYYQLLRSHSCGNQILDSTYKMVDSVMSRHVGWEVRYEGQVWRRVSQHSRCRHRRVTSFMPAWASKTLCQEFYLSLSGPAATLCQKHSKQLRKAEAKPLNHEDMWKDAKSFH